jgi:hypothetical protein
LKAISPLHRASLRAAYIEKQNFLSKIFEARGSSSTIKAKTGFGLIIQIMPRPFNMLNKRVATIKFTKFNGAPSTFLAPSEVGGGSLHYD